MSTDDILSSIAADVKTYAGNDPLRPWLRGVRKLKETLPEDVFKEKLPRFLQKCAQTFIGEERYRNDRRYVGVWIQLMDFVDDAKVLLRIMDKNQIGSKQAAFYIAYGLLYEKEKKFEKAEKMYYLGVQNLAEPCSELHKAYDQFLLRIKKRKSKVQERIARMSSKHATPDQEKNVDNRKSQDLGNADHQQVNGQEQHRTTGIRFGQQQQKDAKLTENSCYTEQWHNKSTNLSNMKSSLSHGFQPTYQGSEMEGVNLRKVNPRVGNSIITETFKGELKSEITTGRQNSLTGDDTVVVKFVGSAIVGKSDTEDACHHGLVDPTINTKEAINAISDMFREPMDLDLKTRRKSHHTNGKKNQESDEFQVFIDDDIEEQEGFSSHKEKDTHGAAGKPNEQTENQKPFVGMFEILEDDDECDNSNDSYNHEIELEQPFLNSSISSDQENHSLTSDEDPHTNLNEDRGLRDDTMVRRFVGSTVFSEPKVEDACHHGLVDPTVNMKEAMSDINSMFGKPINFVRPRRTKKQPDSPCQKQEDLGFSIFVDGDDDDDMEANPKVNAMEANPELDDTEANAKVLVDSSKICSSESDLFEPTIFTKEAIYDINSMFGKPLDF